MARGQSQDETVSLRQGVNLFDLHYEASGMPYIAHPYKEDESLSLNEMVDYHDSFLLKGCNFARILDGFKNGKEGPKMEFRESGRIFNMKSAHYDVKDNDQVIGDVTLSIAVSDKGPLVGRISHFYMAPQYGKEGFAWNAILHWAKTLKENQVPIVTLQAVGVGGYVWAKKGIQYNYKRYGMNPSLESAQKISRGILLSAEQKATQMIKEGRITQDEWDDLVTNPPTSAYEIAQFKKESSWQVSQLELTNHAQKKLWEKTGSPPLDEITVWPGKILMHSNVWEALWVL